MPDFTLSPDMNLPLPIVGVTAWPTYATYLNNCLTIIDSHDHSSGNGVQITPSGLNINTDLTMGSNNLTTARSIRFQPQSNSFSPTASDLGCLYEIVNDLYYRDGAGNQIRITQSGSVSGASGTITGLPSGTASASFGAGTFVFQSATNTAATIDGGSFILRNNTASSHGLTLSPPNAMGADYSLVLPALPGSTQALNLDTSGNIGTITYDAIGQGMTSTGANAIANSRTRSTGTTVAAGGVGISNAVTSFNFNSGSYVDVTNLSVTITTTGRPVYIAMVSDGSPSEVQGPVGDTSGWGLAFVRGSTTIALTQWCTYETTNPPVWGPTMVHIDPVAAGTYTYKVQVISYNGLAYVLTHYKLVVYEL